MRKFLLSSAALIALVLPASAADMAVKAVPVSPFINYGSGWYWGVGTYAGVAQSSVSGTTFIGSQLSGNLTADGAGIDVAVGWMHGNTAKLGFANWYRFESEGGWQNIQGGISVPGQSANVKSTWSATQEADIGADVLAAIMSTVGNLGLTIPTWQPALPANVAVSNTPKQYFGVILREHQLSGTFAQAGGEFVAIAPGVKSGFLYQTVNAAGIPNGGAIDLWASISWDTKGLSMNNVFGTGGPIVLGPGARMGTTYLAGIRADFGL